MNSLGHEELHRGKEALAQIAAAHIVIFGAGAVGSNLAVNLVRQGFQNLRVIDFDRVEEHNLGTQAYGRKDIGMLKVHALRNIIFRDCGVSIEPVSTKLEAGRVAMLARNPDVIVDALDNHAGRKLLTDYANDRAIPGRVCLHVGTDADYAEVAWNEGYRVPEDRDEDGACDYPLARNTVMLAVAVASECLIDFVLGGKQQSYHITLRDRQMRKFSRAPTTPGTPSMQPGWTR
jgi:hypothetical protein